MIERMYSGGKEIPMAKVTNPLLSMSASGKIGDSIVFDKRGRARIYVVPSNPQTAPQMLVRNRLGDIQRELKQLGLVLRAQLKSGFGYTWNALIIKELMDNAAALLISHTAVWTAFGSSDKTAWAGQDTAVLLEIEDGAALYCVMKAAYDIGVRIGATLTLGAPIATNSVALKAEWVA